MTDQKAKDAALTYCREVLGKTAHPVNVARTEEDWTVKVVVEEKAGGSASAKRWYALYEVHLDPELQRPPYHLKKGYWSGPVPAAAAVPTPAPVPGSVAPAEPDRPTPTFEPETAGQEGPDHETEARLRTDLEPPRVGDDLGEGAVPELPPGDEQTGRALGAPVETPVVQAVAPEEPFTGPPAGENIREEATAPVTRSEREPERAGEPAVPAEPEEQLGPAEGLADNVEEEGTWSRPEEELPPLEPVGQAATEPVATAGEAGPAATSAGEPGAAGDSRAQDRSPARPAVQERQGPPKVSFRFAADDKLARPGTEP